MTNKNITKSDIAKGLQAHIGFSLNICTEIVDEFFTQIPLLTIRDKKLMLTNFGKFEILKRKSHMGNDLSTGKPVKIEPRTLMKFKSSTYLKHRINATHIKSTQDDLE
ncbi:MAG: HU family DNA-binding protein [Rickettsiaceae bacterium]